MRAPPLGRCPAQPIPRAPPLLDNNESISLELRAPDVPQRALSDSAGVLVNYILGVAGERPNARALASSKMDRSVSSPPSPNRASSTRPYPSAHKAGAQRPEQDDREQFLAASISSWRASRPRT